MLQRFDGLGLKIQVRLPKDISALQSLQTLQPTAVPGSVAQAPEPI
jgi:hypothetical protein